MTAKQKNGVKKAAKSSQSLETENLPDTRKIGRKVGKNSSNTVNEANTVNSTFDTGAVRSIRNRQMSGRGIKAILNKYVHSSSIMATEKEFRHFQTTNCPQHHPHRDDLKHLQNEYISQSYDWLWLTRLNRNLLIYGIGDKKEFLDNLVSNNTYLKEDKSILIDVIDGGGGSSLSSGSAYADKVVKDLLIDIREKTVPDTLSNKAAQKLFDCIINIGVANAATLLVSDILQHCRRKVYVFIRNIEGPALQSRESQHALSILVACPSICLVATMEHLNTSILWDEGMAGRFRWLYWHMPTFKNHPVSGNFALLGGKGSQQSKQISLSAVRSVLESLTHKHKELFSIICSSVGDDNAKLTKEESRRIHADSSRTVMVSKIQSISKDKMVTKDHADFERTLKEFIDHGILISGNSNGNKYLYVNMAIGDIAILQES